MTVVMVATVARRDIIGLRGKLPGGCVAWRLLALLVTPIKEISGGQEEEEDLFSLLLEVWWQTATKNDSGTQAAS